ncbi:MAG TPA: hypothetical protein VFX43_08075 [Chitinophagaceae bacterium]|nr:hypothetical protein [Chitinophagaceae bacterium]
MNALSILLIGVIAGVGLTAFAVLIALELRNAREQQEAGDKPLSIHLN